MKIIKNSLVTLIALTVSIGSYGLAFAEDGIVTSSVNGSVNVRTSNEDGGSVRASTSLEVKATSSESDHSTSSREKASSTKDFNKNSTSSVERASSTRNLEDNSTTTGTSTERSHSSQGESHRSDVANFVQNLLKIANRDGGIGTQVREIANEKASSSTSTVEAIDKVETRSGLKTFLIGSDFKNLGVLRSELAKTDKLLERLNVLASSTASTTVQTDLTAQIKLLQDDQAKVSAFVTANENSFSLFGWFVKIFNK